MFYDKMEFLSLNITPPEVETSIRWRKKMMAMYSDYKYAHLSMEQMCRKYRCNETSVKTYVSYGKMVTEYDELYPDKCDITHIAFFINLGLNNSQLYGMFGKHQYKLKKMRAILDEQNK